MPSPIPISTLLEITDCSVSALPCVYSSQRQAVLREEALVLAELGDRLLPAAALADGDLEVVVSLRATGQKHRQ